MGLSLSSCTTCPDVQPAVDIPIVSRPEFPPMLDVVWVDVPSDVAVKVGVTPGLLVSYANYRNLAANIANMRSYISQLGSLLDYYEQQIKDRSTTGEAP